MILNINDAELASILAGLRLLQSSQTCPPAVEAIATNDGELSALDSTEIDALCERINGAEKLDILVFMEGGNHPVGVLESAIRWRTVRDGC